MKKITTVFLCSILASCANQSLNDAYAVQKSAKKDFEKATSELMGKGYSCSLGTLKDSEKKLFRERGYIDIQKHTCTKFNDGFVCVDYFFIDLYVADGRLEFLDQQTVPVCP